MPEAVACKGADDDSLASAVPDEAAPSCWLLLASWTPRGNKMLFSEGWILNSAK